jgi:hypothetical protein
MPDHTKRIMTAGKQAGLDLLLELRHVRVNEHPAYTKLFVDSKNPWTIRSVEIWDLENEPPYFKVTHSEKISGQAKRVIDSVSQVQGLTAGSTRTYSTFKGCWESAMTQLAAVLERDVRAELKI